MPYSPYRSQVRLFRCESCGMTVREGEVINHRCRKEDARRYCYLAGAAGLSFETLCHYSRLIYEEGYFPLVPQLVLTGLGQVDDCELYNLLSSLVRLADCVWTVGHLSEAESRLLHLMGKRTITIRDRAVTCIAK